jgi:hypothetical protein
VSAFTPDTAITVTRIQLQMPHGPGTCTVNARIRVTDGTTSHQLTVNSSYVDSGPIALDFEAGKQLTVSVSRAASCVKDQGPEDGNVIVQYRGR